MGDSTFEFTRSLPPAEDFGAAFDEAAFVAIPDGWFIAVTDVENSRRAIAEGSYKAVNMAGVAMISAVMNALGSQDIPYIFGGDGAAVAIAPGERDRVAQILADCVTMAKEELDLVLRAAIVPVDRLRADGFDVRVKLVRISDALSNYAFIGGGLSHAEQLTKDGEYAISGAPAGSRPDLTGLSCRWSPVREAGRKIVSLILEPVSDTPPDCFAEIARQLLSMVDGEAGRSCPMPPSGPDIGWSYGDIELEARATRRNKPLAARRGELYLSTWIAWFLFRTGIRLGGFDPDHYRRYTTLNTDFRKVHDGLRMTLSLAEDRLPRMREWLESKRRDGIIRFGMCVQDSAVLTCYVPSITTDAHFHFLDGAGGGYAGAASALAAGETATTA